MTGVNEVSDSFEQALLRGSMYGTTFLSLGLALPFFPQTILTRTFLMYTWMNVPVEDLTGHEEN